MRNEKREKIINIVFITYLLIRFIIKLFQQSENFTNNLWIDIFIAIISAIATIIENFYIIAIFIVIKILRKKEYKKQLSKIDFKNENNYYRDILKGYSPFLLSYIDNFVFDFKRDIIATLLNLQLKNMIKIENSKIITVGNSDITLEEGERYLLNSIQEGKIKIENIRDLESKIFKDAKNKKLIQVKEEAVNHNQEKITKKFLTMFAISIIIYALILNIVILINNNWLVIIFTILAFIFCNPIFYIILCIIKYYKNKPKIKRTNKGEEINIKLEGLKKYLKEYSKLEEKNSTDMVLWEEYLIYSIIFNLNDKVIKELDEIFYK